MKTTKPMGTIHIAPDGIKAIHTPRATKNPAKTIFKYVGRFLKKVDITEIIM